MANYRLTLCYDGTRWKGWQKQGNTEQTIQGKLEALLTRLLDQPVEVAGSGRTDAGAHAKMQVASFRAKTDLETEEILAGLRRYLPADIGAISLEQVEPRFHARLSCTGKTYVYRIWNSELPNVFERHYLYHIQERLDVAAMRLAAEDLCGTHDFRAFCSLKKFKRSTVRRLEAITIQEVDLSQVADGTYTGSCDAGLVSAQVAVTVEDGAITEVTLTDYHSILGRGAEAIPEEIVAQQRIGVDAVSGATDSSTVIQKAVENALTGAG